MNIEKEVFPLSPMDVVKASYKNSVYFIAGAHDITEYVRRVQGNKEIDKNIIQKGLNMYLKENPNPELQVPMYDFIMLDDETTSAEFVIHFCKDIFLYSKSEAMNVVNALNSVGEYNFGTFLYEYCHTFGCFIEMGNEQLNQNLKFDIVPSTIEKKHYFDVLEYLIRRDYPEDV